MNIFLELTDDIHWEKIRDLKRWRKYCQKVQTKIGQGMSSMAKHNKIKDPMSGKRFYDWEEAILDTIKKEPEERKIMWFWEDEGEVGKSVFTKHLALEYGAVVVSGTARDAKCMIAEIIKEGGDAPKILIMDVTRTREEKISYQGLEELKNGCFCSPKFKGSMVLYDTPHIIVFSNEAPEMERLSKDRWVVTHIDKTYKVTL